MSLVICGLGTAVPETVATEVEAMLVARRLCCSTLEQAMWLPHVYRQAGIKTRHMVLDRQVYRDVLDGTRLSQSVFLPKDGADHSGPTTAQRIEHYRQSAGPLAVQAARQALDRSEIPPRQITHLVTVSCTGFYAPGVDIELIKRLELPPGVQRTHVGFMGCHGALNGLRVARAITGSEPDARVLVCAVELCSLHYQYAWDAELVIANAIFGDGAAAVVGAPHGPGDAWKLTASGSCVFPDTENAMTWRIGDRGFEMTLSKCVPELIAAQLRPWLVQWLARQGLGLEQISSWAIHPGGPKIIAAAQEALQLDNAAVQPALEILSNYGNMSSPTVLFLLDYLQRHHAARPCVAVGFGPGLALEAALFQ